jgi:hypothetical protein
MMKGEKRTIRGRTHLLRPNPDAKRREPPPSRGRPKSATLHAGLRIPFGRGEGHGGRIISARAGFAERIFSALSVANDLLPTPVEEFVSTLFSQ